MSQACIWSTVCDSTSETILEDPRPGGPAPRARASDDWPLPWRHPTAAVVSAAVDWPWPCSCFALAPESEVAAAALFVRRGGQRVGASAPRPAPHLNSSSRSLPLSPKAAFVFPVARRTRVRFRLSIFEFRSLSFRACFAARPLCQSSSFSEDWRTRARLHSQSLPFSLFSFQRSSLTKKTCPRLLLTQKYRCLTKTKSSPTTLSQSCPSGQLDFISHRATVAHG
jgi:hypothetical protein